MSARCQRDRKGAMDVAAAEEDLRRFIRLLQARAEAVNVSRRSAYFDAATDDRLARASAEINEWRTVIEAIAEDVGVEYLEAIQDGLETGIAGKAIGPCQRLLGALTKQERIEAIRGPRGPKLAAARMHPWVWQPAAKAWDAGHRRDAIQRASTSVFDTELRSKVGRFQVKTLDLVGHVFSDQDPKPGDVRLRIPGYVKGTPEWTDAHTGTRDLGLGCVRAIRNLTTHGLDEPNEPVALEALPPISETPHSRSLKVPS